MFATLTSDCMFFYVEFFVNLENFAAHKSRNDAIVFFLLKRKINVVEFNHKENTILRMITQSIQALKYYGQTY